MELNALTALAPVDGRYRATASLLAPYLSEWGLIRHRVEVEVEYLIALSEVGLPELPVFDRPNDLRALYRNFSLDDAQAIKATERTTNHDVKAVEYWLKEQLNAIGAGAATEFVHFGLTSQDVNNTALPLSLQRALQDVVLPMLHRVRELLADRARQWKGVPMLARTHGQPASPVTLGKEWAVFVLRLDATLAELARIRPAAKFGGATGGFNAHHVAYPEVDWPAFGRAFVEDRLGLQRTPITTQIEPYDTLAAQCDALRRVNTVLIDFARDIWQYIAMDYFTQTVRAGEVGSSAMPHKVNPIDFENAEGNLGWANAQLGHLAEKLPISRLQRDLTDSTVLRNLGVPLAHVCIAAASLEKGVNKLVLNAPALARDLENNWAVVAEPIQTVLRRAGYPQPYEALKALTRGQAGIDAAAIAEFIASLDVSEAVRAELRALTPSGYTGYSEQLVDLLG
jgi:adenylosuccinate lyase